MTYQKLLQDYDLSKKVSWKKTKKSAKKKVDGTMKKRKKVQKIKHDSWLIQGNYLKKKKLKKRV